MQNSDVCLLISSCDKYQKVLLQNVLLTKKFFPSFTGNIYTSCSNSSSLESLNVIGIDKKYSQLDFSSRLFKILKKIKENYIIFTLDDFFFYDYLDKDIIDSGLHEIKNPNVGMIVLKDSFSHIDLCDQQYNQYFYVKNKKSPYKNTTQFSIWKKSFLLKTLRKGETAWDFEVIGSYRLHHFKELILYRSDDYINSIPYPKGGVLWGGKIQEKYQSFYSDFDLNNFAITNSPELKKRKPNFYTKLICRVYPLISLIFPWVKRFGSPYYPKYVCDCIDMKNKKPLE